MTEEKIYTISPSAINKYRGCARAYCFEYNEGLRPPSTTKQQFGTDTHSILESWLRLATPPDPNTAEGKTALQGIDRGYLPPPGNNLKIEHRFKFVISPRICAGGIIDCVDVAADPVLVIDHKTTSDLRWAKGAEELRQDPQALLYASWAMLEFDVPTAQVRWVYYAASNPANGQRKPKGCKKTELVFDSRSDEFQASLRGVLMDIEAMVELRRNNTPGMDCPPEPRSCGNFGGCFHAERCNLSPLDKLEAAVDTPRNW